MKLLWEERSGHPNLWRSYYATNDYRLHLEVSCDHGNQQQYCQAFLLSLPAGGWQALCRVELADVAKGFNPWGMTADEQARFGEQMRQVCLQRCVMLLDA